MQPIDDELGNNRPKIGKAGRYDLVCIEGHVYYSVLVVQTHDISNMESIAPKLDDDGKPVKCAR